MDRPIDKRPFLHRSRWAAIGAAVAVVLGGGMVVWGGGSSQPSTFVAIEPVRILDSRDPTNVGLAGPFESTFGLDLRVTGSIPTTTGTRVVVPAGATAVAMNVTVVGPEAAGFVSVRPADATGPPTVSSLNFEAGQTVPNAVTVQLPISGAAAGRIEITYDAYGVPGPVTDVLADVVGYYGQSGAAPDTIASGVTFRGNIAFDSAVIVHDADHVIYVPLPAKSPVALGDDRVNFAPDGNPATLDDDPTCTGTSTAPTAPPGKVCIYPSADLNIHKAAGYNVSSGVGLADAGFQILFWAKGSAGEDMYLIATWAYTAP